MGGEGEANIGICSLSLPPEDTSHFVCHQIRRDHTLSVVLPNLPQLSSSPSPSSRPPSLTSIGKGPERRFCPDLLPRCPLDIPSLTSKTCLVVVVFGGRRERSVSGHVRKKVGEEGLLAGEFLQFPTTWTPNVKLSIETVEIPGKILTRGKLCKKWLGIKVVEFRKSRFPRNYALYTVHYGTS